MLKAVGADMRKNWNQNVQHLLRQNNKGCFKAPVHISIFTPLVIQNFSLFWFCVSELCIIMYIANAIDF